MAKVNEKFAYGLSFYLNKINNIKMLVKFEREKRVGRKKDHLVSAGKREGERERERAKKEGLRVGGSRNREEEKGVSDPF